jgi:hypothetical protein
MIRPVPRDAPFWAFLLVGLFSVGSLACFGIAAAQTRSAQDAGILTTDDCPSPADL